MAVRGRHHPKLLAMLLEEANRVVPVDRLIAGLWDETPPDSARQQIQTVIGGLRKQLGPDGARLRTIGAGYRFEVETRELDVLRCKERETRARNLRADGQTEAAAAQLREALREWRGPVLAGVEGRLVEATARRLEEYRLVLVEARIDLELELGAGDGLVAELRQLTAEQPFRQRFTEQLMLVLHRCGRTPEALQTFTDLSERLADELGVDPGQSLRELHTAILRDDPALAAPASTTPEPASADPLVAPALLPADTAAFTGRGEHLEALDGLLETEAGEVKLAVITGTGGVGKTTLAVRWAHRVADRFGDGQLFVNLRGFDPHHAALGSDEAVRVLLDALGVPHQRIPADPEARFGLYRSLLAERRVLVVLDNAADAAQVRPLIPGGAGNVTLVTSRNPLNGLVAAQGAQSRPIRELSTDEAHELLGRRVGKDRVAAEPAAVEAIIECCARLPLALAVAAARAATHPGFTLTELARELDEADDRLDAFAGGDPATDVRSVFACSYRALTASAARLFRLLGLHPGTDLTAPVAASLAAIPPRRARQSLTELTGAHLLTEHRPGRYTFHDLLRAYANELVAEVDDDAERDAATHRLLDHYLHTASRASELVKPERAPIDLDPARPGVAPEPLANSDQGLAWLTEESQSLFAAVRLAADAGFDTTTWRLAWSFLEVTYRQGRLHECIAAESAALEAARRLRNVQWQVHSHHILVNFLAALSDFEGAAQHAEEALALCHKLRDRSMLAKAYLNLTQVHGETQRYDEAVEYGLRSLELFRELGDEIGEAKALNGVGWYCAHWERYDEALAYCEAALVLLAKLDLKVLQSSTLDSLAFIHLRQRRLDQAIECHRRALELSRETRHLQNEANALDHLGDIHEMLGDTQAAQEAWRQSLDVLERQGSHPQAQSVRVKLDRLYRER